MRYTLLYPMNVGGDHRLRTAEGIARIAEIAERLGFSAIAFTDHPAPSAKWMESGGHESLDPLTALAFVAGVTRNIRLLTYLLVLPYRNPLLVLKQAATTDIVSSGRLTLGVGAGYLKSEFAALGVDFAERNDLLDEAVELLVYDHQRGALTFEGRHFTADAQSQRPGPIQLPHPPLWFGGNSRLSHRRVAKYGQGWMPLIRDELTTRTTRTRPLSSPNELATATRDLRQLLSDNNRNPGSIDVQADWQRASALEKGIDSVRDSVAELSDAGANWVLFEPRGDRLEDTVDAIYQYGEQVIGHV
jgi:probable F420-dependent oxidoreductase